MIRLYLLITWNKSVKKRTYTQCVIKALKTKVLELVYTSPFTGSSTNIKNVDTGVNNEINLEL